MLYCNILIAILALAIYAEGIGRFEQRELVKKNWRFLGKDGGTAKDLEGYMLPDDLMPRNQLVRIQPIIEEFSFIGYTKITFEVLTPTNQVTIHQNGLAFNHTAMTLTEEESQTVIPILLHLEDLDREMYTAELLTELTTGKIYTLTIPYIGNFDILPFGFYLGNYTYVGVTTTYAVTVFEPASARQLFPCFDEPSYKTTFEMEVVRKDSMMSAANMPLQSSESIPEQPGWILDKYQTSNIMTSYTNCILVSEFGNQSASDGNYDYTVYAASHLMNYTDYALGISPTIVTFLEGYFSVPYAMPKLGHVALSRFAAGALENWGLITYIDVVLLYDPETSSDEDQLTICQVLSHETVHQWFGNLVTMEYWEYTWLSEGFAAHYQYSACAATYDDSEMNADDVEMMLVEVQHAALAEDGEVDVEPLVLSFEEPSELITAFRSQTYDKGSSIIRMMKYFLTEATLVAGETNYLNSYMFSNANQDDLFEVLNDQALVDGTLDPPLTVKMIMDTWTLQAGCPVLTVIRNDTTAVLTQNRFYNSGNLSDTQEWYIPITFTTETEANFDQFNIQWMKPDDLQIEIKDLPTQDDQWVIFNIQQLGYFRVNYDEENWVAIDETLQSDPDRIHPINQAQIIDDSNAFCDAGLLNCSISLSINELNLSDRTDLLPLKIILKRFEFLEKMFRWRPEFDILQQYMKNRLRYLYDIFGLNDNEKLPILERQKRTLVRSWMCVLGDQNCITEAKTLFSHWMTSEIKDNNIISRNSRSIVYNTAIASGGEREWNFALDELLRAKNPHEKLNLFYALGSSKNEEILHRYLELTFRNGILIGDAETILDGLLENKYGEKVLWKYIKENTHDVATGLLSYERLAHYVYEISSNLNSEEMLQEIIEFKEKYCVEFKRSVAILEAGIKNAKSNLKWISNHFHEFAQWMT